MEPGEDLKRTERIGQVVAQRYKIVASLGRGGMGRVYRAEHVHIRRPVALKVLHPELGRFPEINERFKREAFATGRVDHPNCVSITDSGTLDDGTTYLVMELLDGVSLADELDRLERIEPPRALHITRHILRGLSHAHQAGIVHRDLKPENIFLVEQAGDRDFAKILDFGVAKLVGDALDAAGGEKLTQAGLTVGSPSYMSPEQASGDDLDGRSDLYSLSIMLYEMLTAKRPFRSENKMDVVRMHLVAEPPPLLEVAPDLVVPPQVEALLRRGLAKKPEERQGGADEYLREVEGALAALEGQASAPAPGGRARPRQTNPAPAAPPPQRPSLPPQGAASSRVNLPLQGAGRPEPNLPPPGGGRRGEPAQPPGAPPHPPHAPRRTEEIPAGVSDPPPLPRAQSPLPSAPPLPRAQSPLPGAPPQTASAPVATPPPRAASPAPSRPSQQVTSPMQPSPAGRKRWPWVVGLGVIGIAIAVAASLGGDGDREAGSKVSEAADERARAKGDRRSGKARGRGKEKGSGGGEGIGGGESPGNEKAQASPEAESEIEAEAEAKAQADAEAEEEGQASPFELAAADPEMVEIEKLIRSGRKGTAIKRLMRLRKKRPKDAGVAFRLGNLYFDRRWWKDGFEQYGAAVSLDPSYRENDTIILDAIGSLESRSQSWRGIRFLSRAIGEPAIPHLDATLKRWSNPKHLARVRRTLGAIEK